MARTSKGNMASQHRSLPPVTPPVRSNAPLPEQLHAFPYSPPDQQPTTLSLDPVPTVTACVALDNAYLAAPSPTLEPLARPSQSQTINALPQNTNGALVVRGDRAAPNNSVHQPVGAHPSEFPSPVVDERQPMTFDARLPATVQQPNVFDPHGSVWNAPQPVQGFAVHALAQVWNGMCQVNEVTNFLQNQVTQLAVTHNEKDGALARLHLKNQELETKLMERNNDIERLKFDVAKHATDNNNLRKRLEEQRAELARVRSGYQQASQAQAHFRSLHEHASRELKHQTELASSLNNRVGELEAKIHETNREAEEGERQHASRDELNQAHLAEVKEAHTKAHAMLQVANAQVAELMTELQNARQEITQRPGSPADHDVQVSNNSATGEFDPDHIDFTSHVQGSKSRGRHPSDALNTEMQALLDEKIAFASECSRLSSQLDQYVDMDARMERTRNDNEQLRNDIVYLRRQLKSQQETEQMRHAEHVAALIKLQQRCEELTVERRRGS